VDDRDSIPGRGNYGFFLFATVFGLVLGLTQPPNQWVSGTPSPGIKWPEREAEHSTPFNVEVKNV